MGEAEIRESRARHANEQDSRESSSGVRFSHEPTGDRKPFVVIR